MNETQQYENLLQDQNKTCKEIKFDDEDICNFNESSIWTMKNLNSTFNQSIDQNKSFISKNTRSKDWPNEFNQNRSNQNTTREQVTDRKHSSSKEKPSASWVAFNRSKLHQKEIDMFYKSELNKKSEIDINQMRFKTPADENSQLSLTNRSIFSNLHLNMQNELSPLKEIQIPSQFIDKVFTSIQLKENNSVSNKSKSKLHDYSDPSLIEFNKEIFITPNSSKNGTIKQGKFSNFYRDQKLVGNARKHD